MCEPGVVEHTCNHSTQEAEAAVPHTQRPAEATKQTRKKPQDSVQMCRAEAIDCIASKGLKTVETGQRK